MKKVLGFLLIAMFLSSCLKKDQVSMITAYRYTIENIMGEELNTIQDWQVSAVGGNGYTQAESSEILRGTQVAGCKSKATNKQTVAIEVHLRYTFVEELYKDMFLALWREGTIHKLGIDSQGFQQESIIYIKIKNEHGALIEYTTIVNASDDNSQVEILTSEYIGKSRKSRDIYEVKIKFQSRMVNVDDASDVIYLKDGFATLKVPNFAK